MRADKLSIGQPGTITDVDWQHLDSSTANRLRDFGVDEGVSIELMHKGPFGANPLALRIGRMTIALRRNQASAIEVRLAEAAE